MRSIPLRGVSTHLSLKLTFCVFLMSTLTGCFYRTDITYPFVGCDYRNDNVYNDSPSVEQYSYARWICYDEGRELRILESNNIPNHPVEHYHSVGSWATEMEEHHVEVYLPYYPDLSEEVTPKGGIHGALGYALNGVKIDPGSGGSCSNGPDNVCTLHHSEHEWTVETLGQTFFNYQIDENNGHIQYDGTYHYHGIPKTLVEDVKMRRPPVLRTRMGLFGWAMDGFPIYSQYDSKFEHTVLGGYRKMKSSYQLVDPVSESRPSVDIYPLGTFKEDYEYVEGSGDLDECNGRFSATESHTKMKYHYIATKEYPYVPRCVKGYLDFPIDAPQPPANIEPPKHR